MHYTTPPTRNPAMASTTRCTYKAENIIALQRQLLAQKHKELMLRRKSKLVSKTKSETIKSTSCTLSRYPLQDIPEKSSAMNVNRGKVVPFNPNVHTRQLIVTNSSPRLARTPATYDDDSAVEVIHDDEDNCHRSKSPKPDYHASVDPCYSPQSSGNSTETCSTDSTPTRTPSADDERSLSTATMSTVTGMHPQTLPLHIPNVFKPAVGCISAPEFLIRCFVARLRKGLTVIKHGRSRFQRTSRLYTLQLEEQGQVLTWKPAGNKKVSASSNERANSSSNSNLKRMHLLECNEVRMAYTPDPDNPRYTGSAILREKCDAADAHKSFALIFPHRTLDITAQTADQCKLLTEGFSALCYRMHLKKAEQERQEQRDQFRMRQFGEERKSCLRVL